jgi:uncharacterized protein YjbI with pentapeptide repeats
MHPLAARVRIFPRVYLSRISSVCEFGRFDLRGANLTESDLTNVDFRGADLREGKLDAAIVTGAIFNENKGISDKKIILDLKNRGAIFKFKG